MKAIEVSSDDDTVTLYQPCETDDGYTIWVSKDQVPLVAAWMHEAAGTTPISPGGRKLDEVKAQAHLFRRLEREAERERANVDVRVAYTAMRIALEWAAAESDLSPDEWWHEQYDRDE